MNCIYEKIRWQYMHIMKALLSYIYISTIVLVGSFWVPKKYFQNITSRPVCSDFLKDHLTLMMLLNWSILLKKMWETCCCLFCVSLVWCVVVLKLHFLKLRFKPRCSATSISIPRLHSGYCKHSLVSHLYFVHKTPNNSYINIVHRNCIYSMFSIFN